MMSYDSFDATAFVNYRFNKPEEEPSKSPDYTRFLLKHLAEFYSKGPSRCNLKILDYGCGPSLPYSISAASKASEIVLADYAVSNREHLQKWVDRDSSARDWTPYFQYIVQTLEGRPAEEAKQREDELRSKVKAIVACDINKDNFIDESCMRTYDIVMSFLCLDPACKDLGSYRDGVTKLVSLVKTGGYFLLYSTRRENCDVGFYTVDGVRYSDVVLKRDLVVEALERNNLVIEAEEYLPSLSDTSHNGDGFLFFCCCKL